MQTIPAPDLMAANALAYAPCGFTLSALAAESESADYGACALVLNGLRIRFRVAKGGQGGKRAIRVYPPWARATSRQAQNTQTWQAAYFVDLSAGKLVDLARVQSLFMNEMGR